MKGRALAFQVLIQSCSAVDGQAGLGLPVALVEEVPEVDRPVLGGQVAGHLPVAVFGAANRSMVPCRA